MAQCGAPQLLGVMGAYVTAIRTETLAMGTVAASGALWGLFWIPLRAVGAAGIDGVWAIVLFQLLPACLLLPLVVLRWRGIAGAGWTLHVAGLFAGSALVLYAGSLVFTEVVRALLLFYMTPLWSTFLARIVLGEPITALRWGTIALAAAGLLLILGVDTGFEGGMGLGDWMGLGAGLVWAIAAVMMKADTQSNGVDFTLAFFVWGSVTALALTQLPFDGLGTRPDWETLRPVLGWFVPVAVILLIPPAFAVMWGATLLSPGLLSILLMTELSAGAITAAIWAGEPFGLREMAGVILISAAGLFEPCLNLLRASKAGHTT